MRVAVSVLALCFMLQASAQRASRADFKDIRATSMFYTTSDGLPVLTKKYSDLVEGTPYFKEEWKKSYIVLADKKVFKDIPVKINLLDNEIYYQDQNGKELIAVPVIHEIILTEEDQSAEYHFVHHTRLSSETQNLKHQWYQSLYNGKADLYKTYSKVLDEQKLYGSASVRKYIRTKERFYIFYKNELSEVKRPKDVAMLISDKQTPLRAFVKKLNYDLPLEDQLLRTLEYLETLK